MQLSVAGSLRQHRAATTLDMMWSGRQTRSSSQLPRNGHHRNPLPGRHGPTHSLRGGVPAVQPPNGRLDAGRGLQHAAQPAGIPQREGRNRWEHEGGEQRGMPGVKRFGQPADSRDSSRGFGKSAWKASGQASGAVWAAGTALHDHHHHHHHQQQQQRRQQREWQT